MFWAYGAAHPAGIGGGPNLEDTGTLAASLVPSVVVGVRLQRTELPGIGVRHELTTNSGDHVGVVNHIDGQRDVVIFDRQDPDACRYSIALTDDEAAALAGLLGTSIVLSQLSDVGEQAHGLRTEQLALPSDSPFIDQPLGKTRARTRTSVSIVAILRGHEVLTSPTPDTVIRTGDVLLAVGTRESLDRLTDVLAGAQD